MAEKILELVMKNEDGDSKVITVTDPRDDVTAAEANAVMQILIDGDVIECSNGKLVEIVEARMRVTEVNVLV